MEVKEAERIVIAKPIASRPTCSSLRSFSDFLASAINVSPSNACSETAITAIRPKTVRFKPTVNRTPVGVISSQAELSGAAVSFSSDKVLKSDTKSTVVYKPLAKLVSKRTVSLLTNLGNSNVSHQQAVDQVEVCVQPPNQVKHHLRSNLGSNLHTNFPSQSEREKTIDPSKTASENLEDDVKSLASASHVHGGTGPSYDGYNWRKYGQKQVKGSKYPRSYYKCTRPNCPVKKKVERSLDGQIAEIVYEGEHNHSKSQPPKRNTLGAQRQRFISDTTGQNTSNPLWSNQLNEKNEGSDSGIEHKNEVGLFAQSTCAGKALLFCNPVTVGAFNTVTASVPDNSSGLSGDCEEGNKGLEVEDGAPKNKRRKNENKSNKAGTSEEGVQEPCVAMQSATDSGIIGDGFHWRKYGQKVVKGNSYPRSYYRCTSLKCNVRKYVERASDNPRVFITTYEGKHNHDVAIKNTNLVASETDSPAANSKDKS